MRKPGKRDSPCTHRELQWRRPCASRRKQTQQDNGGSHPSYDEMLASVSLSSHERNPTPGLVMATHGDKNVHLVVEDL